MLKNTILIYYLISLANEYSNILGQIFFKSIPIYQNIAFDDYVLAKCRKYIKFIFNIEGEFFRWYENINLNNKKKVFITLSWKYKV